ncbi:alpha/beta hydrolase [Mycoplasma sp. ATU-Cv-508]|uniref:serine aminopeptidase domain-containing protein n=1 Tax=Mycoplasma sp. ATU-Cv-508 TaxID=2048001 RepID=UPI001375042D
MAYRKVTHRSVLNWEKTKLIERGLKLPNLASFESPFRTIKTRFGNLKLYRHGKSSQVVVFVNGLVSNHCSALRLVDYWNSRQYSVIAYDNYGWSDSRQFGKTTLGKKEALLLKDVLDFVKEHIRPSKLIVYGESMGGATLYRFIDKFGARQADKFIVDAGYFSFFKNVIWLGYRQIWIFIWLAYLPLLLVFYLQGWPIKSFISSEKLSTLKNVYHLQSKGDSLVAYRHTKKWLPYVKHHVYTNENVRHVLGWYDALAEHYETLDEWIGYRAN